MSKKKKPAPIEVTADNVEAILEAHGHKLIETDNRRVSRHVGNFRETESNPMKAHPLFPVHRDFEHEKVFRTLDGEPETEVRGDDSTAMDSAAVVAMLLEWIGEYKAKDSRAVNYIGKRAIAALWVINPKRFSDQPANKVARMFGLSVMKFSWITAEFSRKFGIKNRFQDHDAKNKLN